MAAPTPTSWSCSVALALAVSISLAACHPPADTEALINEARQYRHQGEHAAAVIQLKNAIVRDGKHAEARRLLGEVYIEQGDAVSAEKELERALALGTPQAQLQPLLVKTHLMQQQFERVLAETQTLAAPALLALRGDAYLGMQQAEQASAAYEAALAREPGSSAALRGLVRIAVIRNRTADATALVARALLAAPFDVDNLRLQGDLLRLEGKQDAALVAYKKILALRPNHPQALVDIANLHTDAGNFGLARADIAQARRASPRALAVYHAQALLDFREGKSKAALDTLQQILATAPEHLPTVLLAGAVQSALGADEQAAHHFEHFLAAYPGHAYASKSLAVLRLRARQPEQAIALLDPLMAAGAGDVELLTLAGEARLRARRFEEAAAMFEAASVLRPANAMLHTGAAISRLGGGDSARAVAELERAASLDRQSQRTGLMLVMAYLRARQPEKALAAVQDMQGQGDSALVQNLKGGVHLALQDAQKARAAFEQALALDPAYLPALDNLARLDMLAQRPADSRRRYEAALAKSPANTSLMGALGRHLAERGNAPDAITWLEKAHAAAPDALMPALRLADLYARAGQARKAVALAEQLQAAHPDNPDALAVLSQAHHSNGNLQAAADGYAQLARMAPKQALAPLRLANIQLQLKDRTSAMASLRKALAIDPDLFDAQITLINLLLADKRHAEAMRIAKTAQRRQPERPAGFKLEGDVQAAQGKLDAALPASEQAFRLAPGGPALVQLHQALQRLGRTAEADSRMRQWLTEHPADVPTRLYFASSKLVARELALATEQLEAILKVEPANVIALNDLAWASQRLGQRHARGYAERAFQLAPDNPAVMDTLAWILVDDGNIKRALPLLQKASALAPEAAEIGYHYGAALAKAGDKRGARRELERALASSQAFEQREAARTLLKSL
jgi:putative PEP-CTERM system TPR-repeat lipoprotein